MKAAEGQRPAPLRRVAIVAKLATPEGAETAARLTEWLQQRGVEVCHDTDTATAIGRTVGAARDRLPEGVDLALVAGGDGTLLSVARAAAPRQIPILGINFGSLGFLTELQPEQVFPALESVLRGDYTVEERQTLRVAYSRGRHERREYAVLNDVVIAKSAPLARVIDTAVRVDGQHVATYTSDGLIVATPTGSTAYNLSAGGPILDPRMSAFVISPICPHTITYRPLVVPSTVRIEITLRGPEQQVYLTLDGQVGFPFSTRDRLRIDAYPHPVRLVRVTGANFFEILRRKLRWGER